MNNKECATFKGMREDLVKDGYNANELPIGEVIDLWLEAAQAYHKSLRGVRFKNGEQVKED